MNTWPSVSSISGLPPPQPFTLPHSTLELLALRALKHLFCNNNYYLPQCSYIPGSVLHILDALSLFMLMCLMCRYYFYLHFSHEEIETLEDRKQFAQGYIANKLGFKPRLFMLNDCIYISSVFLVTFGL